MGLALLGTGGAVNRALAQSDDLAPVDPISLRSAYADSCLEPDMAQLLVCRKWRVAYEAWKKRQADPTRKNPVGAVPDGGTQTEQIDELQNQLEEARRLREQIEAEAKAAAEAQRKLRKSTERATTAVPASPGSSAQIGSRVAGDRPDPKGRNFALIIGNNQYANLPDLSTPVSDAAALSELLKIRYTFRPEDVRLLLNADRRTILTELGRWRRRAGPDDRLMVYYAGHGQIDPITEEGFWQPIDAEVGADYTWIANSDIRRALKGIPAKHILVVVDSCFSGTLTRGSNDFGEVPKDRFFTQIDQVVSRKVIASGGTEPVADAGSGGHSVFAYYLLKTLRENAQPYLASFELYNRLARAVTNNSHQSPQYGAVADAGDEGRGDFTFILRQ